MQQADPGFDRQRYREGVRLHLPSAGCLYSQSEDPEEAEVRGWSFDGNAR